MHAWHRWRKTWSEAVDVYYTPTEFARQKFITGGLPAHKILVKPNFLDPDPGPGAGDGRYVTFVGRLVEEKGVRTLLGAWQQMSDNIGLKIVGDGPLASLVREAASHDRRITWLGQLTSQELLEVVARAALLVFPSVWYETFGRTIMEAFACGTPVLASRMGAMAELVEEGRTGALFAPGDAIDLAARLTEHWQSPKRLAALRVGARREFEVRFTGAANLEHLRRIYQAALSGGRPQAPCSL
jgi:glycosyltransferase involved in cell wall biosynthesis